MTRAALVFSLINSGSNSTVVCYDIASQASNPAFETGTNFGPMACDTSYFYWSSGAAPSITINQVGQDGGPVQMVASGLTDAVVALDTDGTNVYFSTTSGATATLWFAPISGAVAPVKLYETTEPSGSIPSVVAAGGAVYFADVATGIPATSKILGIVPP